MVAHSQIFWFGDLNYRINMLDAEVRKLVSLKKWNELMNYDQVRLLPAKFQFLRSISLESARKFYLASFLGPLLHNLLYIIFFVITDTIYPR